ncbi:MAG: ATP-binding cassette domain-containing protein [Candidatus Hodarchaeota archaeon]
MSIKQSYKYDIEIFNISKIYTLKGKGKSIQALDNINLKVKNKEIFGLLGPNGAGKTTLISILSTLLQPSSGYATILGHNILKDAWIVRENVGLMLGGEMIYHRLTGYKNLKFYCRLYGIKDFKTKIQILAEKLNLSNWINQYVEKYSRGMKLKLALARVLLIEPKILFLDEPMLGLDPITVKDVINILKNLKVTIFLTSHQMDVVSRICDRIAFLREGKILKIDTQENFKKIIADKIKIEISLANSNTDIIKSLNQLEYVSGLSTDNDNVLFMIDSRKCFPKLLDFLKRYPITHLSELKPSLDDVFIKLTT